MPETLFNLPDFHRWLNNVFKQESDFLEQLASFKFSIVVLPADQLLSNYHIT